MVWLERLLIGVAGAALVAIMIVMTTDALGRYLFSSPLAAGFEIVQLLMAVLVFAAIPAVTLRSQHVVVDVFRGVIPAGIWRIAGYVATAICLIISLGFAWTLWRRGLFLATGNEVTANLGAPQAPVAYVMAVTWLLTAGAFLWVLLSPQDHPTSAADKGDMP